MQAIIFDFDGTIVDTETPELIVWTRIFQEHGVEMPADYWSGMMGRGAEQEFERPAQLLERLCGTRFEDISRRREEIVALIDQQPVLPGVISLLDEVKAAGIPCGVASSSKHSWVDPRLERHGLLHYFQTVVCADDVERAKPYPDLFLEACGRLNAAPTRSVAIEDSPNGSKAAVAAGMVTVIVPNPVTRAFTFPDVHRVLESLADTSLAQLRALLP